MCKNMKSMTNQCKIKAQRHPKERQGVQNEPRGVPETSRRRPRVSKKDPGGANVDLVVFYNSKWDPKGIPEGSRAFETSPEACQRRPKGAQDCQRKVQEEQSSIYSCFTVFLSDPSHSAVCGAKP